jgi:serine/threonine protein kinase/tetratricopeptide (TPR) repeat protein
MSVRKEFWTRARPLFDELVELDSAERRTRLDEIGRDEPALRETLDTLLRVDAIADDPLHAYSFTASRDRPNGSRMLSSDPLGIIGKTVSHFRVTGFVAAGGMGIVYSAEDLQLARTVALKFPAPHQQITEDVKGRFLREARAVAGLDHPNLCSVYEIGDSAEGVFLAMPLYAGETLKDRLARVRQLAWQDAVEIVRKITTGLAFAHARGIVHRDLKPGNIMLMPDGSVKILDFGLAKVRDFSQTKSHATIGTITYMSPEQIRGSDVDSRADLWAVGVMLYEMLTGATPFRGDHELTLMHAILYSEADRVSDLKSDVPRPVYQVITGLLQKDRSHRYESPQKLLSDLDALERGEALRHRVSLWTRAWQRKNVRTALVGGSLVLVVVAFGVSGWKLAQSKTASTTAGASAVQTLAVMPFGNSEPESTAYLVSGFLDGVVSQLSIAPGLRIAGQSSAAALQRQGFAPRVVGERLGAGHVLVGDVKVAAESLRTSLRMVRVSDNETVWKRDFKAPLVGILSLQQQAADSILNVLQLRPARSARLPTSDTYAYDLYLKARYAWEERTREKLDLALGYYRGAVERDPQFALAYAAMAEAYVNMQNFGYIPQSEGLGLAEAASGKAIAIDTTLAEAFTARGQLLSSRARYSEAERYFRRAIDLDPSAPSARHYYALLLTMLGRFSDARAATDKTLFLDPLSVPANSNVAIFAANTANTNDARAKFERAQQLGPNYVVTLYYFGAFEASQENYAKAAVLLEKALNVAPNFTGVRAALAYTYMHLGRTENARRLLADARNRVSDERSRTDYALTLAIMGKFDEAFSMMGNCRWDIPTLIDLRTDPLLHRFRADERYPKLLARLNLRP